MASQGLLAGASGNSPLRLCRQCLHRRAVTSRQPQRRFLGLKVIEKRRLAQLEWSEKAQAIKYGTEPHLWDIFKERGYIKDVAGTEQQIRELMRLHRIGAYVGIDPTAPSLHVGHLLPLMPIFWMYMHGFRAYTIIGGATVKIGDPTDRLKSRETMSAATISTNIAKTHYQVKRIWLNVEVQARKYGYEKQWAWERGLFNNSMWYNQVTMIEVVNRLFKGMRMGPMLSRETFKRRMESGEGMSLAEFVYPLIQAWDWWHMFSSPKPIHMQIGGSDQYGNIVSGIEAIKHLRDTEADKAKKMPNDLLHTPVGFTVPLLTDSSGAKFGKSAGNAVWLDRFMTSTYDLYGYFMRRPDADVEGLLKQLTFLPLEKIATVMQEHNEDPSRRIAQHTLAFQVVALVHSDADAVDARARHVALHPGSIDRSNFAELEFVPAGQQPLTAATAGRFRADIKLPESLLLRGSIARILHAAGIAQSASEANRLARIQGAYVGGAPGQKSTVNKGMIVGDLTYTPVKQWFPGDTKNFLIDDKILILRRGKHFIRVVEMVSDEWWEKSGQRYNGEPYKGRFRMLKKALEEAAEGQKLDFKPSELEAILAETQIQDHFKNQAGASDDIFSAKISYVERRKRGMTVKKARHLTPMERALMQFPRKLDTVRKFLARKRTPEQLAGLKRDMDEEAERKQNGENDEHEDDEENEEDEEYEEGEEHEDGEEHEEGEEHGDGEDGREGPENPERKE
ncbi:tyrosyl-tRNA synthetase [Diatrype stigma]|uniref:Tyrosine--tRNA ligase n=1 Tax=Diatrype stigma TaxID=117547 RepID=A0AAN9UR43_9PEZI